MIQRLLLHFGYALLPLDLVARALAAAMLRTQDVDYLEPHGTQRELARQYMVLAVEMGLPAEAARRVAALAWDHMMAGRKRQPVNNREFSFYG